MAEKFRKVGTVDIPPLEIWVVHGDRINLDIKDDQDARVSLTVAQARELRDWLTAALPCDHQLFTGQRRADPFGKSEAWVSVKNECTKCGSTIDGSGDANG